MGGGELCFAGSLGHVLKISAAYRTVMTQLSFVELIDLLSLSAILKLLPTTNNGDFLAMKINLEINGTEKQIRNFFMEFLGEARTKNLMQVLQDTDSIEKEDLSENPLYEHFDSLSWETVYLAHIVEVKGRIDSSDNKYLTYDEIVSLTDLSEKQISARIGGTSKVANNLGTGAYLESGFKKGKRACILRAEARPVLMYALEESSDGYEEWLDNHDLENPDSLDE